MFRVYSLTEEIRLEIFGCPDLPDLRPDLLSDWDSVYPRENLFEILGTLLISWRQQGMKHFMCLQKNFMCMRIQDAGITK